MERRYLKTHPWLTFEFDLRMVRPETWINLGEVVRGALDSEAMPVDPRFDEELLLRYRAMGIFGTAALDGSLAELGEVAAILEAVRAESGAEAGKKGTGGAGTGRAEYRTGYGGTGREGSARTPDNGGLPVFPDSRDREVRNILDLFESIGSRVRSGGKVWDLSAINIRDFNRKLLEGVEGGAADSGSTAGVGKAAGAGSVDGEEQAEAAREDGAAPGPEARGSDRGSARESTPESVPGAIRAGPATEIAYAGVPAEDCEHLVERLCTGLAELRKGFPAGRETVGGIVRGLIAHLYLSWILPFERANGRTARMAESQIMLSAGVPEAALHLLGAYYNRTSRDYLRLLGRQGGCDGDPKPFIEYAIRGLLEAVRDRVEDITVWQRDVVWESHVRELLGGLDTKAAKRQTVLATDLAGAGENVPAGKLRSVSPRVAAIYAGASDKTLARDVGTLAALGLVEKTKRTVRAKKEIVWRRNG